MKEDEKIIKSCHASHWGAAANAGREEKSIISTSYDGDEKIPREIELAGSTQRESIVIKCDKKFPRPLTWKVTVIIWCRGINLSSRLFFVLTLFYQPIKTSATTSSCARKIVFQQNIRRSWRGCLFTIIGTVVFRKTWVTGRLLATKTDFWEFYFWNASVWVI